MEIQLCKYFLFGRGDETVHLLHWAFHYYGYLVPEHYNDEERPDLGVGEEVARTFALPDKAKGDKCQWMPLAGLSRAEPLGAKPAGDSGEAAQ